MDRPAGDEETNKNEQPAEPPEDAPVAEEQASTESPADPGGSEPAEGEPAGPEPAGPELAGPELAGGEPAGADAVPVGPATEPIAADAETSPTGETLPAGGMELPDAAGVADGEPRSAVRRIALIAGSVVVGILVLAGGAYAAFTMLFTSVDPADRLPDSVIGYAEINLDPSLDQTPKIVNLVNHFAEVGGTDERARDIEEALEAILAGEDLGFLDPDDLASWVGTRAAIAGGIAEGDEPYATIALASRDDDAAESTMAKIADEVEREADYELGYVVDDGLVIAVLPISEDVDAPELAGTLVAEGRESPLSAAENFVAAREAFARDQIVLIWMDFERYEDAMDVALAKWEEGLAGEPGYESGTFERLYDDLYGEMYADVKWFAMGASVTGGGIDIYIRSDSPFMTAAPVDWREQIGALPQAQLAGVFNVPPEIKDSTDAQLDLLEDQVGDLDAMFAEPPLPNLEYYERGIWSYMSTVTDELYAEYETLFAEFQAGRLAEGTEDYERLVDLDYRLWIHGTRSDYDQWAAATGGDREQFMFERALTDAEYYEMDEYDRLYNLDALPPEDEPRYWQLVGWMQAFGLASDYEQYQSGQEAVDVRAIADEVVDMIVDAGVVFAADDIYADAPTLGASVTLAEGPAERIFDVPTIGEYVREFTDKIGDEVMFDGPTVTVGDLMTDDGTLADHPLFEKAFEDAPDDAVLALFLDVDRLKDGSPGQEEALEPVHAVSMVSGSESALIRILVDTE